MKPFLFIILVLTQVASMAQIQRDPKASYTSPQFLSNEPIWHYTVYDSTNIGFPIEGVTDRFTDGYNDVTYIRPWNWKPTIVGDYMYGYTTTFGTTSYIYGAIIYKIDLRTGQILWQSVFDNRHSDRQEYVQSIEIKNNAVEVITMRRLTTHLNDLVPFAYNKYGADSYICTRNYDINSGLLINYQCWDKDDVNTAIVAPHSEGNRIFQKNNDNQFIYLNNKVLSKKHLELSKFTIDGKLSYFRIDTMYYPRDKYPDFSKLYHEVPGGKMVFLENDTILVAYNYDFFNGVIKAVQPDLCYIQMYNKALEPINRLSTGKFFEMYEDAYNVTIRYATEKYIVLGINRTNTTNMIICDYEMNIISNTEFFQENKSLVIGYRMLEYSKKPIMITKTWGASYPREIPQSLDYYIYENGGWQLKFTQEMGENHYLDEVKYLTETENHDLLMCVDHGYYNDNLDISCYETDLWMLIDGNKLGIKTSNQELYTKNQLLLYPNPTSGKIHIQGFQDKADICIQNIDGQVVKTVTTTDGQVDISDLPSGLYIFEVHTNLRNETHKILKVD